MLYKVTLPQLPLGIGQDEGISTVQLFDSQSNKLSKAVVLLTQNQKSFALDMRPIPNKLIAYSESNNVYIFSALLINQYTAQVTMISGGDSTDLDSVLNVPNDYHGAMIEYLTKQLMTDRTVIQDTTNDGVDAPNIN